jgi:uncharacterized membrane protein YidH (DUF202 family)
MDTSTPVYTTPSRAGIVVAPIPTRILFERTSDSSNNTVVFESLGLLVAAIGVVVAALQLRRMRQQQKVIELYELA